MPNRILKESICTSDTLQGLSWFEEVLFYRLIVACDDFGRFDARPAVIRGRVFPLVESLTAEDVAQALQALADAGLLQLYSAEERPYLQLCSWEKHQRIRNQKSKYPAPPCVLPQSADNCAQLTAIAPVIQSNPNPNPNPNPNTTPESEAVPSAAEASEARDVYLSFAKGEKDLFSSLAQYEAAKASMGKPLSKQGRLLMLTRLQELSGDPKEQREILNRSIRSGWSDLYPLPATRAAPKGEKPTLQQTAADAPSPLELQMVQRMFRNSGDSDDLPALNEPIS